MGERTRQSSREGHVLVRKERARVIPVNEKEWLGSHLLQRAAVPKRSWQREWVGRLGGATQNTVCTGNAGKERTESDDNAVRGLKYIEGNNRRQLH